jgi:ethylbenzene dioxygenase subunit beta
MNAPHPDRLAAVLLWHEVHDFLVREARLLDAERYDEWIEELLADDVRYWMPARETVFRQDEAPPDPQRMNFYNETKTSLRTRVSRLKTGTAWSENPRTRYRHLVTNIEVEPGDAPDTCAVRSNVLVYRNRLEREESWLVAARQDLLRRERGTLRLARREITLDQNALLSKNLNVYL